MIWSEISKNPHAKEVKSFRVKNIVKARKDSLIDNRINYLSNLVRGKDVLDIGVVGHNADFMQSPNWLHKHISKSARNCLGVDILEDDVNKLRQNGFNVICTDITQRPIEQKFDVIICGEVMEHLNAPGYLFNNMVKMLNPGGKIVITVPNPWYAGFMIKNIFDGSCLIDNVDHVCWFDACTICELAQRYNLHMESFRGIKHSHHNNQFKLLKKLFFGMTPLLIKLGLRSELFAKSMIYEFVL